MLATRSRSDTYKSKVTLFPAFPGISHLTLFALFLATALVSLAAGFTEIEPPSAGIRFTNALPNERLFQNFNLMNGSGVAAGDFDGDGHCDLYFCAISGTNALYRNLGNWQFEDVTTQWGVACPNWNSTGAAFADIDGDGRLDLLVSTLGTGVHLFRNETNRFTDSTQSSGLATNTGSTTLALADIDGDGDLDLFVANYGARAILRGGGRADVRIVNGRMVIAGPNAYRLRIVEGRVEEVGEPDVLYRNENNGKFTPLPWNSEFFRDEQGKPSEAPWDYGLSAVLRDFNGDGAPDLYVCNDFQTVDRLWLNDGTGRFRLCPRLALRKQSFSSMGIDLADIDRDGFLDFFVTEMRPVSSEHRLRSISGSGAFYPEPGMIQNRPEVTRNTLFWNRGNDTFAEIAEYSGVAATDWSWQPFFLDVDLDGYEDLLVLNGALRDVQDRDVLDRIRALLGRTPEQNRTNVLMFPAYHSPNVAFRNEHNLKFAITSTAWHFDSRKVCQGACLADLDNDGDLDLVSNALADTPLLCRNDAGPNKLLVRLKGLPPNSSGIGALIQVSSGGLPLQSQEMISGGRYLSGDEAARAFALAGAARVEVTWRSGRKSILEDVRPGAVTIAEQPGPATQRTRPTPPTPLFTDRSNDLPFTHRDEQFDDYSYQPLLPFQLSQRGPGLALFDLDADGVEELVIGASAGGKPAIARQVGNNFELIATDNLPPIDDDLLAICAWVWPDKSRSLLLAKSNLESHQPKSSILQLRLDSSGQPSLSPLAIDLPDGVLGALAAVDFDGDSDLDLFAGIHFVPGKYPAPASSRLYRQENDRLIPDAQSELLFHNLGNVVSALWLDLNADGFSELIVATEWGPIKIFRNDRGQLRDATAEWGLDRLTGIWTGLASGDFDADGNLDFVAGNWGENTSWTATPERPFKLWSFDSPTGGTRVIEAEYDRAAQTYFPVRALNVLSRGFPTLAKAFPDNASFARATLSGLLQIIPDKPRELSVSFLQTAVFLNRTNRFEIRSLPLEAQLSPAFAPVIADFNNDGAQDIFLSQNFFAFRPELPRADAGCGLILLGNGDGSFKSVTPRESGIAIFGEQRGALFGTFAKGTSGFLLVAQNAAPLRLFSSRASQPHGFSPTSLMVPNGGIGAIIRPAAGPALQLHSGAGWLSQPSLMPSLRVNPSNQGLVIAPGGKQKLFSAPSQPSSPPGNH